MNKETVKKINREIGIIFTEDQRDRDHIKFDKPHLLLLKKRDQKRKNKLEKLLGNKTDLTYKSLYMIAMIYQHGSTLNDYKRAVFFSRRSMKLGFERARWLYAAAQDRLLMKQGRRQRYGTQYQRKDDIWFLYPVSKSIDDRERKKYNVPTLKEALYKLGKLNKK